MSSRCARARDPSLRPTALEDFGSYIFDQDSVPVLRIGFSRTLREHWHRGQARSSPGISDGVLCEPAPRVPSVSFGRVHVDTRQSFMRLVKGTPKIIHHTI